MIIDVTDKVKFDLNDDESLPLTKCVCGKEFAAWNFTLNMEEDYPTVCPYCKRKLFFQLHLKVFEITPYPDLKKEVSNEEIEG